MNLRKTSLSDVLKTFDVSEENGVVEVNLADALMAIAAAINRLAASHEDSAARMVEQGEQIRMMLASEMRSPGRPQ